MVLDNHIVWQIGVGIKVLIILLIHSLGPHEVVWLNEYGDVDGIKQLINSLYSVKNVRVRACCILNFRQYINCWRIDDLPITVANDKELPVWVLLVEPRDVLTQILGKVLRNLNVVF